MCIRDSIDTGGGNAVNAADITERLIAMGVAGVNIEDQIFPKRCGHMEGKQVIDAEEMAGKVRAMVAARDRAGSALVINARTDACAVYGLSLIHISSSVKGIFPLLRSHTVMTVRSLGLRET